MYHYRTPNPCLLSVCSSQCSIDLRLLVFSLFSSETDLKIGARADVLSRVGSICHSTPMRALCATIFGHVTPLLLRIPSLGNWTNAYYRLSLNSAPRYRGDTARAQIYKLRRCTLIPLGPPRRASSSRRPISALQRSMGSMVSGRLLIGVDLVARRLNRCLYRRERTSSSLWVRMPWKRRRQSHPPPYCPP